MRTTDGEASFNSGFKSLNMGLANANSYTDKRVSQDNEKSEAKNEMAVLLISMHNDYQAGKWEEKFSLKA